MQRVSDTTHIPDCGPFTKRCSALLMNDPQDIDRARIIRQKGAIHSRPFQGQVDRYTSAHLGSSYLASHILAAFLRAELEASDQIRFIRRRVWQYHFKNLHDWTEEDGMRLSTLPDRCEQPHHLYQLRLPSLERRQPFTVHLKTSHIFTGFRYLPLRLSRTGQRFREELGDHPVTEDVSQRLGSFPFHNSLSIDDGERAVGAAGQFRCKSCPP